MKLLLLLKNTFKKIYKSLGRFLSIMLIIALGISVFIGLSESTAGMLYTADNYYDENNLMDFKVISTYGFTEDDVSSLKEMENVELVIPSYSLDVISEGNSIRVHAYEKDVNNVLLTKGRMPKNENECVADFDYYKIGDKVIFESDDLDQMLSISECEVVGLIKSVLYIRAEKGISSVGNGKLVSYIFVNRDAFISEYYTEVYITSRDSKKTNSYYDEYEEKILPLRKELEEIKPIRETIRYEEILREANEEINDIKNDLDKEINESNSKLQKTKIQLDNGRKELESRRTKTLKEIENNKNSLTNNKNLIITNLSSMGINEGNLSDSINNLSLMITNYESDLALLEPASEEYQILSAQIAELKANKNGLNEAKTNLDSINNGLKIIEDNYNVFVSEIAKQSKKLDEGYVAYQNGVTELKKAEKEANEKIAEAREELNNIEKPIWYLLDRTDNSGYITYKEDVVKVDAVARILPVFFIIVVILMILNTLTRLIEEERTEIGILQSNGFSKTSIIFSYLVYVITAGLIGIQLGLAVGYSIIPKIIYSVFLGRYYAPKLITVISPLPFSLVISITIIIMVSVTTLACMKELKEVPAALLRPKPPKTGKKIFIENFTVFWSKLNFMGKTTIRNLFRYKKRIVMTTLGVAGCTALLMAGMGMRDSVNTLSTLQYKGIIKYDAMYVLNKETQEISDVLKNMFAENGIVNPLLVNQNAFTFTFDNKTEDVYVVSPQDIVNFNNYVSLTSKVANKRVSVPKDGAAITKQLADNLNLKVGDSISIRNTDNELFILRVSDIVNNYVAHYIYISKEYYEEIFDKEIAYNTIVANGDIEKNITLSDYDLLTITFTDEIIKEFDSFVSGLDKVIILIVVLACFLAFIVLYNLTIINVSERKREIATFKVLGFYDKEIAKYVYRETFILTVIGTALGLLFGIYLHRFIMATAETDNIVFLRRITLQSYVLSALITIAFSYIVQLIINKTLKHIDMIESLKSTE